MPHPRLRAVAAALLVGGSFMVSASVVFAGPPPTTASAEQSAEATKHYAAGVDHYKAARLAEALAEFQASYDVVASPNSHLMVARVLKDQGAIVDAYLAYQATEREALALVPAEAKYQVAADGARQALGELTGQVALVTLHVSGGQPKSLTIGGHEVAVAAASEPTVVAPGKLTVTAVAADGRTVRRDVEAPVGATTDVALDLAPVEAPKPVAPPPVEESSGVSMVPFIIGSAVVGAGGFALFGAFGAMNNATFSELETACPNDRCGADAQSKIDDGTTQQLVANIGLGVGAVGIAAAATFLIVELATSGSSDTAPAPSTALVVGPGSFGVRGTF